MQERRWIDTEVQKSKDQSCYQMSKFITDLLRHNEIGREQDAGVPYDRIVEKYKENLSKDSRYWPNEVKQHLEMAPHWSAEQWIDVLSKGGGQKRKVSILFETKLFRKTPVTSSHSRAYSENAPIDPVLQDNLQQPKDFTKYVYHVGHGNELRSMVRNGLIPGGFSTKTSRYAVFYTVVDPMDDEQQGLRETFLAIDQKQESRLAKILGNQFKTQYSGAMYCPLEKEDCDFTKQGPMRSYSHCLQDSMRKHYA